MIGDRQFEDILSESGGSTGEGGEAAFRMTDVGKAALPVVIAVPHAGRAYPSTVLDNLRLPELSAIKLEDRFVDRLAIEAGAATGAAMLMARAPRAMIDLNRDPQDVDWGMVTGQRSEPRRTSAANRRARSGLGLVPRRLTQIGELWRHPLRQEDLDQRLRTIHRPYHECLSAMLDVLHDRFGVALLIDVHSMPPLPRPDGDLAPTEFVIGDRFGASCDARLAQAATDYLLQKGRVVSRNRPYAGGYVLDRHAAPLRHIHGLQLEICRTTYLDTEMKALTVRSQAVTRLLTGLVRHLADTLLELDGSWLAQAAE